VWAYETTPGTAAITVAASTSYEFGQYDPSIEKWQNPTIENVILEYLKYNRRTPYLEDGKRSFPTFKNVFNPTTAQFLVWILGKCTSGTPNTAEPLDQGSQYPLTIRHEQYGGTNEQLQQAVGSYCVSAYGRAQAGSNFTVELDWAFQKIEDEGDASRDILTTTPTKAGGSDEVDAYVSHTITYDKGGGGEAVIPECVKAEFRIKQDWKGALNGSATQQTVYKYQYKPVELILTAILEDNASWNDLIDRNVKDYELALYKPDESYYIKILFDACRVQKIVKSGWAYKGYYEASLILLAEEITVTFVRQGSGTFSDHYKGEVV